MMVRRCVRFELLPAFKECSSDGLGFEGYGCAGGKAEAVRPGRVELARASFVLQGRGVQAVFAMGSIISTGRKAEAEPGCRRWRAGKRSAASDERASVGSGNERGHDNTDKREGIMDSQRQKRLDRQRAMVRYIDIGDENSR